MSSHPESTSELFERISDKNIIDGVRNQDDTILNWLYDNYLPTVRKHVLNNNGTNDDVSDVFQDTIIILYKQITDDNLSLTTDLKGYFFGIARNIWSALLRKKLRMTELDLDFAEESGQEDVTGLLLEKIIIRAFNKLKPDMQKVLSLYSRGYSYKEIAVKLNLKNENYARRKKYISKEALLAHMKEDPEYQEYLRFLR